MNLFRGIKVASEHLVMLVTKLLPRNRKMIIFGAWWGNKYEDNSRYLFEYTCNNRPDIKAFWFSSNKDVVNEVNSLGFPAVYSHSLKAIWIALRARYVYFCTSPTDIGDNIRKYIGGCTLIDSWHGIPIKKIMNDDIVTRSKFTGVAKVLDDIGHIANPHWYVICTSEAFIPIYQSAFGKSKSLILNIGQARNDYFFIENSNPIKELYKGKKIIVYLPTHRKEGRQIMDMYSILDLESINNICKKNNAIFLIKKHYYHRNEKCVGGEFECIKELTNENSKTPLLLAAADILISDYSSVFSDYLILNRPEIFYCYDLEEYLKNDREMYFDYKDIVAGPICKNSRELVDVLSDLLDGNDLYSQKRKEKLDFFYSKENQGAVSPRQIDAILKL